MRTRQAGFTILELMIATAVFGILLLIASGVIVGLSRQLYKSQIQARTQEVARNVSEEIASAIQFSASPPDQQVPSQRWCIADKLYEYTLGRKLGTSGTLGMRRSEDCAAPTNTTQLLGENMRLAALNISSVSGNIWQVTVRIAYGDDDLLDDPNGPTARCRGGSGSQFCAASEYSVIVGRRIL